MDIQMRSQGHNFTVSKLKAKFLLFIGKKVYKRARAKLVELANFAIRSRTTFSGGGGIAI